MRRKQILDLKGRRDENSSAFGLFIKALIYGTVVFIGGLFVMLLVTGMLPYWQIAIRYSVLWIMPLVIAIGFFLDTLIRNRKYAYWMWGVAIAILVGIEAVFLINPPDQFAQLRFIKSHAEEIVRQQEEPLIADVTRISESKIPLYVETRSNANPLDDQSIEYLVNLINALPETLTERAAGIYFVDEDEFQANAAGKQNIEDFAGYVRLEQSAMYIKMHDPAEADLYLYVCHDGEQIPWGEAETYKETMIHELIHLLDIQYEGENVYLSNSKEWQDLFAKHQYDLSEYAATDPVEFFAEAGTYYFLYPDLLKQSAPDVYDWFVTNLPDFQPDESLAFFDSGSQSSAQSGPDREQVQKEQVQKEDVQKEQVLKRKGKAVVKERQCGSGKGKRKRFRRGYCSHGQINVLDKQKKTAA